MGLIRKCPRQISFHNKQNSSYSLWQIDEALWTRKPTILPGLDCLHHKQNSETRNYYLLTGLRILCQAISGFALSLIFRAGVVV